MRSPCRLAGALARGRRASSPAAGSPSPTADGSYHGATLDEPYAVPETPLTDTDGEPYSLAADTDKPLTLVFFGYTHCPDICQVVMSNLASALTRLDEADREQVDVVFVTTDPARDDAQMLRTYLDRFDPAFVGLTGDLDTIIDVGQAARGARRAGREAAERRLRGRPTAPRSSRSTTSDRVADALDPGHLRGRLRRRHPQPAAQE